MGLSNVALCKPTVNGTQVTVTFRFGGASDSSPGSSLGKLNLLLHDAFNRSGTGAA
jgi:hypothetical protein